MLDYSDNESRAMMTEENTEYVKSLARRGMAAEVVDHTELVEEREAARQLGRPWILMGHYCRSGVLAAAIVRDESGRLGQEGVSRASIDAELEWRRTASLPQKIIRSLKLIAFVF